MSKPKRLADHFALMVEQYNHKVRQGKDKQTPDEVRRLLTRFLESHLDNMTTLERDLVVIELTEYAPASTDKPALGRLIFNFGSLMLTIYGVKERQFLA